MTDESKKTKLPARKAKLAGPLLVVKAKKARVFEDGTTLYFVPEGMKGEVFRVVPALTADTEEPTVTLRVRWFRAMTRTAVARDVEERGVGYREVVYAGLDRLPGECVDEEAEAYFDRRAAAREAEARADKEDTDTDGIPF